MHVPHTIVVGVLAILLVLMFMVFALRFTLRRADKDLLKEHKAARHLALHLVESYILLSCFKQSTTTPPPGVNPSEMEATFDEDIKHVMEIIGTEYLGPGADEFIHEAKS